MNFILVKHPNCSQLYLFRLPEHIRMTPFIDVNCETRYGVVEGTTVTPSFEVPEEAIDKLCDLYGTRKSDLKFVKSVTEKREIDLEDTDTLTKLASGCKVFGEVDFGTDSGEEEEEDKEEDDEEEDPEEFLAALGHALVYLFDKDKEEKK